MAIDVPVSTQAQSGYMTLPLPVIGNVFAPSNAILPTTVAPSIDDDSSSFKRPDTMRSATFNQRGTPPIFWAVLWNKCFSKIDDHYHAASANNNWSNSGKKIGITSLTAGTLNMANQAFDDIQTRSAGYAIQNIPYASLDRYINPVDESRTTFYSEDWSADELQYPAGMADPYDKRYSLFSRMRTDDVNIAGYPNDFVGGGTSYITTGVYSPSISLMWNCGSAYKEACELVNNVPSGSVLGSNWLLSMVPSSGNSTELPSAGVAQEANFQNWVTSPTHVPVGIGNYTRGDMWMTLRPFQGILDDGTGGMEAVGGQSASTGTFFASGFNTQPYGVFVPQYDVSATEFHLFLGSGNQQPDPSLDIPRPYSFHMNADGSATDIFYSPVEYLRWFEKEDAASRWNNDKCALRTGKLLWVVDFDGVANTKNVKVTGMNTRYTLEDSPVYTRWYEGGVQKTTTWTNAAGATGDILTINTNRGSVLIVKGPWEWATNAAGSVEEGVFSGGYDTFYAYFLS